MRIRDWQFRTRFVFPANKSMKVVGIHGVGKSATIFQESEFRRQCLRLERKDYGWYDLRLSQNDVGDLKGFPFMVGGRTYFAPPAWFPIHPEDLIKLKELLKLAGIEYTPGFNNQAYGDLFLDEVSRGGKEARQCVFQLVNDRRLGDWRIPDGWRIFAADNPANGGYQVSVSDPAEYDRYTTVNLEPDLEDFISWAEKKGSDVLVVPEETIAALERARAISASKDREHIHPVIRKYLQNFPLDLDPTPESIEASLAAGGKKLPSRRSWEALSNSLCLMEDNFEAKAIDFEWTDKKHKAFLVETVNCYVGKDVAIRFADFVEKNYKVLTPEMVLSKWNEEVKVMVAEGNPLELAHLVTQLTMLVMTNERSDKGVSKKERENLCKLILTFNESGHRELISALWMASSTPALAEKFSKGTCKSYLQVFKENAEINALIQGMFSDGSIKVA